MGRGANITEPLNPAAIPPAADSGSGHSSVPVAATIPADVRDAAEAAYIAARRLKDNFLGPLDIVDLVARAIIAERERTIALLFARSDLHKAAAHGIYADDEVSRVASLNCAIEAIQVGLLLRDGVSK